MASLLLLQAEKSLSELCPLWAGPLAHLLWPSISISSFTCQDSAPGQRFLPSVHPSGRTESFSREALASVHEERNQRAQGLSAMPELHTPHSGPAYSRPLQTDKLPPQLSLSAQTCFPGSELISELLEIKVPSLQARNAITFLMANPGFLLWSSPGPPAAPRVLE